jgi:hypothetical protein
MVTKPLPVLGFVIGVIAAYCALVGASYAATKVVVRVVTLNNETGKTLPWIVLTIVLAVVLGGLMITPAIGAGVTTGAGALLTVAGLVIDLVPVRQMFDVVKLFEFPGVEERGGSYMLLDGSLVLFGVVLLMVGLRRWVVEGKAIKASQGLQQPQDRPHLPNQ